MEPLSAAFSQIQTVFQNQNAELERKVLEFKNQIEKQTEELFKSIQSEQKARNELYYVKEEFQFVQMELKTAIQDKKDTELRFEELKKQNQELSNQAKLYNKNQFEEQVQKRVQIETEEIIKRKTIEVKNQYQSSYDQEMLKIKQFEIKLNKEIEVTKQYYERQLTDIKFQLTVAQQEKVNQKQIFDQKYEDLQKQCKESLNQNNNQDQLKLLQREKESQEIIYQEKISELKQQLQTQKQYEQSKLETQRQQFVQQFNEAIKKENYKYQELEQKNHKLEDQIAQLNSELKQKETSELQFKNIFEISEKNLLNTKQELKTLKSRASWQISGLDERLDQKIQEKQTVQDQCDSLSKQLKEKETLKIELEKKTNSLVLQLEQSNINDSLSKQQKEEIANLKREISTLTEQQQKENKQLLALQNLSIKNDEQQRVALQQELIQKDQLIKTLKTEISNLKNDPETINLITELQQSNIEQFTLLKQLQEKESQIENLNLKLNASKQTEGKNILLKQNTKQYEKSQLTRIQQKSDQLHKDVNENQEQINKLQKELIEKEQKLQQTQQALETEKYKCTKLNYTQQQLNEQIQLQDELIKILIKDMKMVDLSCFAPNSPEYQIDKLQSEIFTIKQTLNELNQNIEAQNEFVITESEIENKYVKPIQEKQVNYSTMQYQQQLQVQQQQLQACQVEKQNILVRAEQYSVTIQNEATQWIATEIARMTAEFNNQQQQLKDEKQSLELQITQLKQIVDKIPQIVTVNNIVIDLKEFPEDTGQKLVKKLEKQLPKTISANVAEDRNIIVMVKQEDAEETAKIIRKLKIDDKRLNCQIVEQSPNQPVLESVINISVSESMIEDKQEQVKPIQEGQILIDMKEFPEDTAPKLIKTLKKQFPDMISADVTEDLNVLVTVKQEDVEETAKTIRRLKILEKKLTCTIVNKDGKKDEKKLDETRKTGVLKKIELVIENIDDQKSQIFEVKKDQLQVYQKVSTKQLNLQINNSAEFQNENHETSVEIQIEPDSDASVDNEDQKTKPIK
ncbi:Hypothetical_protein [Hexamita inflata]|uniref:Hypothetical_protein n=1 Tax=Hexamita inflata TaxID=28002 RepID=A0AA86V526_9EUKA|nr:Hypothetical protein HINF_LOCUS64247 [Hexamita inflata]